MLPREQASRNDSEFVFLASKRVELFAESHPASPFLLGHEPPDDASGSLFGYRLATHAHSGVRITGSGLQSERLPCFVLGTS